jgi:hypothetical protein
MNSIRYVIHGVAMKNRHANQVAQSRSQRYFLSKPTADCGPATNSGGDLDGIDV